MSQLEHYKLAADHAVYRPIGDMTLGAAVKLATDAITHSRSQGITKLLINATGLTGFDSPGLGTRYAFMHEWARAAGGMVRVALVVKPELIDPKKFGVSVGIGAGLVSDVFTAEPEALAWLLSGRPPQMPPSPFPEKK